MKSDAASVKSREDKGQSNSLKPIPCFFISLPKSTRESLPTVRIPRVASRVIWQDGEKKERGVIKSITAAARKSEVVASARA